MITLSEHPYGRPYLHIPTGKVIYLSNKLSNGNYQAHFQFRESMVVDPKDLDYPLTSDIKKFYPI